MEFITLTLDPPITIPYLSKPRARLCAFSFLNSFTNTDTQSDNNTVKLAWKAHSDTDWDTPYDDLPWKYTEFTIPNSFQDPAQLEVTIAKKIHELSGNGAPGEAFGGAVSASGVGSLVATQLSPAVSHSSGRVHESSIGTNGAPTCCGETLLSTGLKPDITVAFPGAVQSACSSAPALSGRLGAPATLVNSPASTMPAVVAAHD